MTFPLFNSHLDLAHTYWQHIVQPGDIVVDATCGNGQDTLFLSSLLPGLLYAIDIQSQALENAKTLLGSAQNVIFHQGCHSSFPDIIKEQAVKLIVYNLGYLPGGDKALTTKVETTLLSLQKAENLVMEGGVISVTCYPGHPEGAREEKAILDWATGLNRRNWSCCHHRWCNRVKAPGLLLIQKRDNRDNSDNRD